MPLLLVIGCGARSGVIAAPRQAVGGISGGYDDRAWAAVLRENVKDELVDYGHLAAHREPLDQYLGIISATGPQTTPDRFATPADRACYYINGYNAGILAAVLGAGAGDTLHRVEFGSVDEHFRLQVDGRLRSLSELRAAALTEGGDARVVFALCDGALGSPPLHDQPLRPAAFDDMLDAIAQRAMDNRRIVSIDHENQSLLLSTTMMDHRDGLIAYCQRRTGSADTSMLGVALHFANSVRRQWLNTAVGYIERMIPFDRRLNRWSPDASR